MVLPLHGEGMSSIRLSTIGCLKKHVWELHLKVQSQLLLMQCWIALCDVLDAQIKEAHDCLHHHALGKQELLLQYHRLSAPCSCRCEIETVQYLPHALCCTAKAS